MRDAECEAAGAPRRRCQGCERDAPLFAFTMAFQPIVDLHERRIVGHEALVRGPDGAGAAQVLAQVTPATLYAFDQACRVKAIELASRLGMAGQLSINFLPNAVYEPRACIRATLEAAARSGFDPRRLTFEVVESEALAEPAHLRRIVQEYRRQGFAVALDDFGTCYSGLARLADLRPDIVKLDRELVRDCDRDTLRLAIVASVIALGRSIGTRIVLEGVERTGEAEALRAVGGRYMQGFLFAKPRFEAICTDQEIFGAAGAPDRGLWDQSMSVWMSGRETAAAE
jgi:EAL domain-containing protein (putative c-di-GMP-specific phosphodiesterase class I)